MTDGLNICTAGCNQAERTAPEHSLPETAPDIRKLFLYKAAAGRFVSIDELGKRRVGMPSEKDMDMIFIMIPFLHGDVVITGDVFEDLTKAIRDFNIPF